MSVDIQEGVDGQHLLKDGDFISIDERKKQFLIGLYSTLSFEYIYSNIKRLFEAFEGKAKGLYVGKFFSDLLIVFTQVTVKNNANIILGGREYSYGIGDILREFNRKIFELRDFFETDENKDKEFTGIEIANKILEVTSI